MKRAFCVAIFSSLTVVVCLSSLAWACSPEAVTPTLNAPSPSGARPGTAVKVTGAQWQASRPVEIRWGSEVGPVLARDEARDGSFSVTVTTPEAEPGIHYFVAVQGAMTLATPFEVATPGPVSPAPSGGSSAPRPSPSAPSSGTNHTARVSSGPGPGQVTTPTADAVTPAEPVQTVNVQPATAVNPADPEASLAITTTVVPAVSDEVASPTAASAPGQAPYQPASRVVSDDLWSGLGSAANNGTSLLDLPSRSTQAANSTLGLGVGLFASAVVALFAGFGLGEFRRRRATATSR